MGAGTEGGRLLSLGVTADFTGGGQVTPPDPEAGERRARQGADFLRRRLQQIRRVHVLAVDRVTVTFLTPAPAAELVRALAEVGADISTAPPWEGTAQATVGWWHTRAQLVALSAAIEAFLSGAPLAAVPSDSFARIPTDLASRTLPEGA